MLSTYQVERFNEDCRAAFPWTQRYSACQNQYLDSPPTALYTKLTPILHCLQIIWRLFLWNDILNSII